MECWANCLGDCSDEASREHLVSKSLFQDDVVRVSGLSWCREPKDIGITNLTAKILCRRHNSLLSPVDEGGAAAFDAFRELRRIANIREKLRGPFRTVVKHSFDGPLLERWLLKTTINLSYKGDKPIGRGSISAGIPPDDLVRIAFGRASFYGRAGLSFILRPGMQIKSEDALTFAPLLKDGSVIEGGLFVFRGQQMLLFLEPGGAPPNLSGLQWNGEDLGNCQFNFHNTKITVKQGKHISQVLKIHWPNRP